MTRLRTAELTSGVSALVLDAKGVRDHADERNDTGSRLEGQAHAASEPWVTALYWACWLLLAGVVTFLIVGR